MCQQNKLLSRSSKTLFLTLAICLLVSYVSAQHPGQNPCTTKTTCHECIQTSSCAWCLTKDFGDKPRCFQPSLSPDVCDLEYNPDNEQTVLINRELTRGGAKSSSAGGSMAYGGSYEASSSYGSSYSGRSSYESGGSSHASGSSSSSSSSSSSGSIVQIAPQRVNLKLRINQPHSLQLRYSQAQDYPIDLYYLMDLSKSMEDDKDKLSTLGVLLSDTMKNITSNFRLGFGSFVDKVLMPYVSTIPKKLEHPCDNCAPPYGYRNHMDLSEDTDQFSSEVNRAAVSGNLDAPEGGFDAIMQAIVCRKEIGWREQARRLLVFSTDAGFHYAGDGKLGGVIAPNDGECHMENQMYTHSTIQDYPSISQINHKVKENQINIIFAVTQQQIYVYEKLAKHVQGSSSAVLSNDSSNVVDLVREEYSKISSLIEMKDNATSAVKITYYSACLNGSKPIATSKCEGLKVGDVVSFTAEIVVTECPRNPKDWNQFIQIYPVGINETLVIDLEMLCGCPCEHAGHEMYQVNSDQCHTRGTYMCGICECGDNYYGRKCECSATDSLIESSKEYGCRQDNTTLSDCSGRGTCVCGVCDCEKRPNDEVVSGKYCECDNFSCDRHNQLLCSGPTQGICECGTCNCKPGWGGSACDCRLSTDTCIAPNSNGEICSGHGTCECGVCKCKQTNEGRYFGKYCEKCPTCSGRCLEFKDCVQCQMYKTGPLKEPSDCKNNCTLFTPIDVEKVVIDEEKDEYLCRFYDDEDCKFEFKYSESDEKLKVEAQHDRECPPKVFMLGIILMVIGAIVLIGLALLVLWKVLTTIHDRREFARFEKEREMAKWDTGENPIYIQATSTFKNPTYAGK